MRRVLLVMLLLVAGNGPVWSTCCSDGNPTWGVASQDTAPVAEANAIMMAEWVCGYQYSWQAVPPLAQAIAPKLVGLTAFNSPMSGVVISATPVTNAVQVVVEWTSHSSPNSTFNFAVTATAYGGQCVDCPVGEVETFGYNAGTWDETSFNFTGGPSSLCSNGCTFNSSPSSALDVLWYENGIVWVNEEFISDGSQCSGQPDAPSESPPPGSPENDWPDASYCDQGGGSDGSSFCDTRDPNHPEYDPDLPSTEPGAIYCDEQGGHDGRSFCNTWSPHHPGHPDYDGTGDGSGGTSGEGSYPGPGGGGTGGTGEGGEGEEPPQIGFCPPGTVQSERHFHGEDQTAVCVPEGDEFDESLDGLDLSGELPPGWLVMPTLPVPSGGTCACPADHTISVMGSSVPISYGPICGVAELLRPVFLLLVYLGLAFFLFRMVAGGNK